MKLKCKINEKIYDIVQGCSFTDNYEETLDSGTIILSQIPKIENLDPYDDVFIWDSEKFDFDGFENYEIIQENDYKNDFQVQDNQDTTFKIYVNSNTISKIIETISNKNNEKEIEINFYTTIGHSPLIPEIVGLPISMSFNASVVDGKLTLKNETYPNGTVTLSSIDLTVETTFLVPKEIVFSMPEGGGDYYYSQTIETDGPDQNYMSELGFTKFYTPEIRKYKKTIYNGFYKHMLIDQFSYEMLNTVDFNTGDGVNSVSPLYNYTIQLFSEIKAMEKIILPNISVTQSLNVNKKKTIYQYICDFLEMYSPKIKVVDDAKNKTWKYEQKYHIGEEMKEIFNYNYPQDFTLNTPTLRELITTLMKTKNMIPYVTDNLVYGLDITQRTGEFNLNLGDINFITGSKTSDNYANTLRTEYQQALSSKSTCRSVEYVGFRNSSEPLMTLDNMRLELSYPIYKINSVKLCYFNKAEISNTDTPFNATEYGYNLIEQDITPLILLDNIRNMLPDDWESVNKELEDLHSLEQLSKVKFCTIGYSQGSNYISGWGQRYTYFKKALLKWYEPQKTVIENILQALQNIHPQGNVASIEEIYKNFNTNQILLRNNRHISPFSAKSENFAEGILTRLFQSGKNGQSVPLFFKSLLFKVDYEAYYNGTIIHSKSQDNKDDICSTDNQASSLALLEEDGLAKIEKLNRFGNVGYQIMGRYTNKFYNYDYIQPLGSVLNIHSDNDIVIYSREYSIWDNEIVVRYSGMKDHVLKNFYTSVFAKYRLYNVMGANESVQRNENIYTLTLLSKDEQYYESEIQQYYSTSMLDYINRTVVAAFEPNVQIKSDTEALVINKNLELNICYIKINNAKYACDFLRIVSGHTLSFNFKMFDNASMGVYISVPSPFSQLEDENIDDFFDWQVTNDYTGSKQQWYMTVDDKDTGFTENMTFCVGTVNYDEMFNNDIKIVGQVDTTKETIKRKYENSIFAMPKVNYSSEQPFVKISKKINKDNKETINMTVENELLSKSDDVMVSDYLLHLSNIDNHKYMKNDDRYISYYNDYLAKEYNISSLIYQSETKLNSYYSVIEISQEMYAKGFVKGRKLSGKIGDIDQAITSTDKSHSKVIIGGWQFEFKEIVKVTNDYFDVLGSQTVSMRNDSNSGFFRKTTDEIIRFRKTSTLGSTGKNEYGIKDYYGLSEGYTSLHLQNIYGHETFLYYGRRIKVGNLITTGWLPGSGGPYHYISDSLAWTTNPFILLRNEGTMEFNKFNDPFGEAPKTSLMFLKSGKESGLKKDQVFNRTMFIRLSDSNMSKTIEYEEYKQNEITMSDLKVSDIIKFKQDPEKDNPYIYIDLSNINNLDNIKSVQYWYWDTNTSSYHFVFGVNITDEDKVKKYIKVYISVLTKKDTRVYDKKHNIVGNSLNYAKSTKKFGKGQYYE